LPVFFKNNYMKKKEEDEKQCEMGCY
jgi:hypothetical protein